MFQCCNMPSAMFITTSLTQMYIGATARWLGPTRTPGVLRVMFCGFSMKTGWGVRRGGVMRAPGVLIFHCPWKLSGWHFLPEVSSRHTNKQLYNQLPTTPPPSRHQDPDSELVLLLHAYTLWVLNIPYGQSSAKLPVIQSSGNSVIWVILVIRVIQVILSLLSTLIQTNNIWTSIPGLLHRQIHLPLDNGLLLNVCEYPRDPEGVWGVFQQKLSALLISLG